MFWNPLPLPQKEHLITGEYKCPSNRDFKFNYIYKHDFLLMFAYCDNQSNKSFVNYSKRVKETGLKYYQFQGCVRGKWLVCDTLYCICIETVKLNITFPFLLFTQNSLQNAADRLTLWCDWFSTMTSTMTVIVDVTAALKA